MKTRSFLESLGIDRVHITSDIEEADFAIAHGSDVFMGAGGVEDLELTGLRSSADMSAVDPLLSQIASRKLRMYSANPDLKVVAPDGSIQYMPGVIAKRYAEEYAGEVIINSESHIRSLTLTLTAGGVVREASQGALPGCGGCLWGRSCRGGACR